MKLTAVIEELENGLFTGRIEELPAVMSQGKSVLELKANLVNALYLHLDTQKQLTARDYKGKNITREELIIA